MLEDSSSRLYSSSKSNCFAVNGVEWMRCMACGAEMILVKAIEDVTMPVPGFEHRAYMCSLCNETEHRLVFNKREKQSEAESAAGLASVVPTSSAPNLIQRAKRFVRLARAK
jgi:hypothetical protein